MDLLIEWTETAQRVRERIYTYWNNRNKSFSFSKKLEFIIQKEIQRAKLFPNIGLASDRINVRFFVILKNYKLFYKIHGNRIIILRLWDVRRSPGNLSL